MSTDCIRASHSEPSFSSFDNPSVVQHSAPKEAASSSSDLMSRSLSEHSLTSMKSGLSSENDKYLHLKDTINNLSEDQLFGVYQEIEAAFRAIEHKKTTAAWIQQADLLDAIDFVVEKSNGLFDYLSPSEAPFPEVDETKNDILLIPYERIRSVNERITKTGLKTFQEVHAHLGPDLVVEKSSVANKVVKIVTKQNSSLPIYKWLIQFFLRIITALLGFRYKRKTSVEKLAKFSLSIGITPFEVIARKKYGANGSVTKSFEYRGVSALFGKSIRDFSSEDEWFARDWQEEARALYTQKATIKEVSLSVKYGLIEPGTHVVISNADARLRCLFLGRGEFEKPLFLAGKVLTSEAQSEARLGGDNLAYYSGKYRFLVKNLLGRSSNDNMQPKMLPKPQEGKLFVREAQHELLGCAYRFFEARGAVLVVLRLAPADVHNYGASLKGRKLSHLEAVEFFSVLEKDNEPFFEELREVFSQQERVLGRPSQSTIDIYGTVDSVSAPAITRNSGILSQNDRKVMFYLHEDMSISMHVFIGATGVNRVDVDPSVRSLLRGSRKGDMRFGRDTYQADPEKKLSSASSKTTRDGQRKLRLGEWQGTFPINGSTVLSFYLPTDFVPYEKIQRVVSNAHYETESVKVGLEIKAQMGSPLLIKTEIRVLELLEEYFPELFNVIDLTVDEMHARAHMIYNSIRNISPETQMDEQFIVHVLDMLKNSPDANLLKEKIINLTVQRLQIIQDLTIFIKKEGFEIDFDSDDLDINENIVLPIYERLKNANEEELPVSLRQIHCLLNKDHLSLEDTVHVEKWKKQVIRQFSDKS